nr:SNF2 helicase associated domain-containing protein [Candidatus Delongbacteria bacterium]
AYRLTARIQWNESFYTIKSDDILLFGKDRVWFFTAPQASSSHSSGHLQGFELHATNPELLKKISLYLGLVIPSHQLNEFIEKHYLHLQTLGFVVLPDYLDIEESMGSINKVGIGLRDYQSAFALELRFHYGNYICSYFNDFDIIYQDSSHRLIKIIRDREKEKRYAQVLLENRVKIQDDLLLPAVDPVEWLTTWAPNLIKQGFEILGQDTLLNQRLVMQEPRLKLEISTGMDWFDLKMDIEIGGFHPSLSALTQALIHHQRYIRLSNGSLGIIPEEWITRLAGIIGFLGQNKNDQRLRASRTQLEIIDSLIQVADKVKTDQSYEEFSAKVSHYQGGETPPLPISLQGHLRDYQVAGYQWLHFLKEFGYGGCLADEMGLGKTVQALSILLHEKERGITMPSLIVVPTTLIFNWLMEIEKFTPGLKVQVHHGTERCKDLEDYRQAGVDTVLTTYGIIRNDVEMFEGFDFNYIILDESQQIKNPLSKNAQCMFRLKALHRLSLTGTPIENNSLDLWSQFNFLNPGMLGNIEFFRNTFTREIEIEQNTFQADRLRQLIAPFILLRKKDMVAKELPDKQYIHLYAEMEPEQRELYDEWKMSYRYKILDSVKNKGFNQSRMLILQGLIRLRQICNHPKLVDPSYTGQSSKFNLLIEQIEDAVSQGHKLLVFSSFVKMLTIFRHHFDRQGMTYCYLDGSTRNRKEVVDRFQQDQDIRIFLISLKAGGVGLNLTAADYVFIVDPWWNPAAEMQAIDRTHRIGQTRHVFIYKSITRSSVEEKILKLQEKKLKLVKSIISVEENIFKYLSMDDIYSFFND